MPRRYNRGGLSTAYEGFLLSGINPIWFVVGLLAQCAFSARFLVQWILSERARKSLMPVHFWYFSCAGAVLLLAYATHQRDLVICLGQMAGLAIYLRNLELDRRYAGAQPPFFAWPWLGLSSAAIGLGWLSKPEPIIHAITTADPLWTLIGMVGQVIFTGRFMLQLWFSERANRPVNPIHFWYMSMIGSVMLFAYAVAQRDPIIILGQSFGIVVYLRNLALIRRQARSEDAAQSAELN
ncbi:Uncharacterized N-terminal domain of lipid-A-disaccharide synthase [Pseudomonas panipatensis]|uniref:Uncharacterized N-terminal domain of lipid-A-disaccharide synthase n=1 Tax=Pseudomonas panipatensis TaxID=428992 RepID=A0A1G8IZU7_9PSED|nr:Uncharacterized N-terminal domain of lipid-A-disaccharide synthase [Pseudomonas panipatensis]SMP48741.1 Uncharacterized N-terminal domain of lipid-A-disaccharide synthase [Pseudomonas panipatensis]